MILQLNPAIPVNVVAFQNYAGPFGSGIAHFLIDPGIESNLLWVVAMDQTGQIWTVPNPNVRMTNNITLCRNNVDQ